MNISKQERNKRVPCIVELKVQRVLWIGKQERGSVAESRDRDRDGVGLGWVGLDWIGLEGVLN